MVIPETEAGGEGATFPPNPTQTRSWKPYPPPHQRLALAHPPLLIRIQRVLKTDRVLGEGKHPEGGKRRRRRKRKKEKRKGEATKFGRTEVWCLYLYHQPKI